MLKKQNLLLGDVSLLQIFLRMLRTCVMYVMSAMHMSMINIMVYNFIENENIKVLTCIFCYVYIKMPEVNIKNIV